MFAHTPAVNEVQDTLVSTLTPVQRTRFARLSAVVAGLVTADGTPLT